MFFNLILSVIVGSASAFIGWLLQMLGAQYEVNFWYWNIVFYALGAACVLAGLIDFARCIIILCRRGGRRGGNLPKLPKTKLPKR